jgi:hypothetical protein
MQAVTWQNRRPEDFREPARLAALHRLDLRLAAPHRLAKWLVMLLVRLQ